jgi:hypothetical protein
MTRGIFIPTDMEDRPFPSCSRLYFSAEFLALPPSWCTVIPPGGYAPSALTRVQAVAKDEAQWPKGTRITFDPPDQPKTVWVLTGRWLPLTTTTTYEGRWPD